MFSDGHLLKARGIAKNGFTEDRDRLKLSLYGIRTVLLVV